MDYLNTLNRDQLIQELRKYDKYKNKSDKYINNKFKTLRELKMKVKQLYKEEIAQKIESNNNIMIHINDLSYDQLITELRKYEIYKNKSDKYMHTTFDSINDIEEELKRLSQRQIVYYTDSINLPILTNDIMLEILLKLDKTEIDVLCYSNKSIHNICFNSNYWKNKLLEENLPILDDNYSIQNYILIKNAVTNTHLLMDYNTEYSLIYKKNNNINNLLKNYFKFSSTEHKNYDFFISTKHDPILIQLSGLYGHNNRFEDDYFSTITYDQLYLLIINMFYENPNITIKVKTQK